MYFANQSLKLVLKVNLNQIFHQNNQVEHLNQGLLREGDRRVSIESNSASLIMEFQSGAGAQLKPVKLFHLKKLLLQLCNFQ
jgi:hypothetical protein